MSADPHTIDIPSTDLERRYWVMARLRRRHLSFRSLARELGVAHQSLCDTMTKPNGHLEQSLADACGVPVERLFPERFDPDTGLRLYGKRPQNRTKGNTAAQTPTNVHREKAA